MTYAATALHPSLLVATDLAVGGLLYLQVSPLIGLLVVAAGVLLLCGVAYESLRRDPADTRPTDRTPVTASNR